MPPGTRLLVFDTPTAGSGGITRERILRELRRDPLKLGYKTNVWTVALLAHRLSQVCQCPITERTLRRRMKEIGLVWKRPRYVFVTKDPHRAQKKGQLSDD
jgi:transposase